MHFQNNLFMISFFFPTISRYTNKHHFLCFSFIIFIFLCLFRYWVWIHPQCKSSKEIKVKPSLVRYECQFQKSSEVKRVVAFNIPSHSKLRHYEQDKVPDQQLKNLIIKEDSNCIFNQQSVVHQALSSDVRFTLCPAKAVVFAIY